MDTASFLIARLAILESTWSVIPKFKIPNDRLTGSFTFMISRFRPDSSVPKETTEDDRRWFVFISLIEKTFNAVRYTGSQKITAEYRIGCLYEQIFVREKSHPNTGQ